MRALMEAGTTPADAARDGFAWVVEVPDSSWAKILRDEWRSFARRGERYEDGDHHYISWRDGPWIAWAPEEQPPTFTQTKRSNTFAEAIARGHHCVEFATDLKWLPADLVEAADHHLILPKLTADDIRIIATSLCGRTPTEALSDEQSGTLTPRHLQLARRLGQTADAYVTKLRFLPERSNPFTSDVASEPSSDRTNTSPRYTPDLTRLHGMDEAVAFGMGVAKDVLFLDEVDSFPNRDRVLHRYAQWDIQIVNALQLAARGLIGPRIAAVKELARILLCRGALDGSSAEVIVNQYCVQDGGEL